MSWLSGCAVVCVGCMTMALHAQTPAAPAPPPTIKNTTQVPPAPVRATGDRGSTGETSLDTPAEQPATDLTPATSPVAAGPHGSYFLPGATLSIRLIQAVDSGHQKNGDSVAGVLTTPVKTASGRTLPPGTPVEATVLSSAPAGKMTSYGVLTLQLLRVGGVTLFSNVLDFNGQEGHKDLPDSAPDKGTEAAVAQGTVLRFKVLGAGDNPDPSEHGRSGGGGGGGAQTGGNSGGASGAPATGSSSPNPQTTSPAPGTQTPH